MTRDDRFELYYFWGQALYETAQDALAFEALRQAINQDPGNARDASLWAKYYLGILYERRGEARHSPAALSHPAARAQRR